MAAKTTTTAKKTERTDDDKARAEARNVAIKRLRENHQTEYNEIMVEEMTARGIDWKPRLTPEEKAQRKIEELLAENPALSAQYKSLQGGLDEFKPVDDGNTA